MAVRLWLCATESTPWATRFNGKSAHYGLRRGRAPASNVAAHPAIHLTSAHDVLRIAALRAAIAALAS